MTKKNAALDQPAPAGEIYRPLADAIERSSDFRTRRRWIGSTRGVRLTRVTSGGVRRRSVPFAIVWRCPGLDHLAAVPLEGKG